MVSFWPWKADETASFEKTLSALHKKISTAQNKLSALQSHSRRYKALWTLYAIFLYTIYALILLLVTGRRNWGYVEYSSITGGPIAIYGVRRLIEFFYSYRTSSTQAHLDVLQQQRDDAIANFKKKTNYDSTQQLLEKYGAASPQSDVKQGGSPQGGAGKGKRKSSGEAPQPPSQAPVQRTGLPPPPTANIRRPVEAQGFSPFPQQQNPGPLPPQMNPSTPPRPAAMPGSPDFNQGQWLGPPPPSSPTPQYAPSQPAWYDRILDVLLGEDETRASSRLALICQSCKLVNGQAPPGTKSLEEVGKWRCKECRAWNGTEADIVVNNMKQIEKLKKEDDDEVRRIVSQGIKGPIEEAGTVGIVDGEAEEPKIEEDDEARRIANQGIRGPIEDAGTVGVVDAGGEEGAARTSGSSRNEAPDGSVRRSARLRERSADLEDSE